MWSPRPTAPRAPPPSSRGCCAPPTRGPAAPRLCCSVKPGRRPPRQPRAARLTAVGGPGDGAGRAQDPVELDLLPALRSLPHPPRRPALAALGGRRQLRATRDGRRAVGSRGGSGFGCGQGGVPMGATARREEPWPAVGNRATAAWLGRGHGRHRAQPALLAAHVASRLRDDGVTRGAGMGE